MKNNGIAWGLVLLLAACGGKKQTVEQTRTPGTAQPADTSHVTAAIETDTGEQTPEAALYALYERSVRQRFEGFENHQSGDLEAVARAYGKAGADMFVHVVRDIDRDVYRPAPRKIGDTDHAGGGYWPSDEAFDAKSKGLRAHGGVPVGEFDEDARGNWIRVFRPEGYPGPLAANTPGIIWEVDGSTVVFVTVDGGRYHLQYDDLAVGLPDKSKWPGAIQHDLLTDDDVRYLVKAGSMPESTTQGLAKIQDEFNACTVEGWKNWDEETKKALVKGKNEGVSAFAKIDLMHAERTKEVGKRCQVHIDAFDAALVKIIDGRRARRMEILGTATAKAESNRRVAKR